MAVIVVQGKLFPAEVRQGNIHVSVFVEVGGIDAHAPARLAVFAVSRPCLQADFLPSASAAIRE